MTYAPQKPRIVAPVAWQPHRMLRTPRSSSFGSTHDLGLQTKLVLGGANDPLEREADAIAERVTRGGLASHSAPTLAMSTAQRQSAAAVRAGYEDKAQREPDDEDPMMLTEARAGPTATPTGPQVASLRGKGALPLLGARRPVEPRMSAESDEGGAPPLQRRASELRPSRPALELPSLSKVQAECSLRIPPQVRAPLESALGHDFSLVRIHTGPAARGVARELGAEAFTSRNDIVFARDRYRPDTPEGLNLLTHELVHTIQQRSARQLSPTTLPVARAPVNIQARMAPPSAEDQEVDEACSPWASVLCEDAGNINEKYESQREALRELVREIDRVEAKLRKSEGWSGDGATTPTLAQSAMPGLRAKARAVVDAGPEKPTPYQPPDKGGVFGQQRLELLLDAMVVRLRTIELRLAQDDPATAASTVLIEWQHDMETARLGRPPRDEPTSADIRASTAESVMDQIVAPSTDLDDNLHAAEALITAIELRRKALREGALRGQPIENYFVHLQSFLQAAIDELGGRAARRRDIREELRRLHVVLKRLEGVLFREIPDPLNSRRTVLLGSIEVDGTKGAYEPAHPAGPQGRHDDFFGAKASVKVYPYSVDGGFDQGEVKLSILAITRSRIKQVEFLADIYGSRLHRDDLDVDDALDKTRADLAQLDGRGLDLHSDSDWREYLLKRLHEHNMAGTANIDAYRDLVSTIRAYFDAFAVHSPYNIEDFGDSYLDRDFPRALSGQLIHDCGVYALRVAYMLSLVRKELGLTFHFVRLPFHFALVIRGRDGLPTLVVNNDDLEWVEDGVAQELVKKHNLSAAQVAGELASHHFAPGTRMPFFASELGPKDFDKRSMWRAYKELSGKSPFSDDVADPSSPLYGRDLAYLVYMRACIDAFNESVYVLWTSTLPKVWRSTQKELRDCRSGGSGESSAPGEPMGCEKRALRAYRTRSKRSTIEAINTYLAATSKALEAVPHAMPPQLVFIMVPSGRSLANAPLKQTPATTKGLEPGLAVQGAAESHPEIMFDSGVKPGSAPASRIELIKFLILSVQDAELDMSHVVVSGDSFEIVYADSPADPETGVQFGAGKQTDAPADYLPPFARREHAIERLR